MRPSLLFAALLAAGCAPAAVAPRTVLLVEVDTLRSDVLGCYGGEDEGESLTPALDALADEGVLFERAYASAPWTVPSIATLFSGRWPHEHGALRLLEPVRWSEPTLAERFREAGWRTGAVMTNFVVKRELGFDRGFERWDQELAQGHEGSTGEAAVARLLALADELARRPGEGLFLYLLLFEPHWRYEEHPEFGIGPPPPDGRAFARDEELSALRARRAELDADEIAYLRGLYRGEVAQVDRALGALLDGLEERGLAERALVAFTADHGEELMERGWIGHTRTLHDELVRVPLVLRLPAEERAASGVRIEHPVSQVDLGATLLDLVGLAPELGGGRSFAATVRGAGGPPRRHLLLHTDFDPPLAGPENREKRALQWGVVDAVTGRKWIVDRHPERLASGGPEAQLYDLESDPAERNDLADREPAPEELFVVPQLDPAR